MPNWMTSHPRARREHRCSDCRRIIRPGETYRRGVGFEGGTLYSEWKDCQHCEFVLNQYDVAWDGEYNEDTFTEWAGDGFQDITEARLQAGYRNKWTTAQGNLWPLPVSTHSSEPLYVVNITPRSATLDSEPIPTTEEDLDARQ